jgi:hypothetical protein
MLINVTIFFRHCSEGINRIIGSLIVNFNWTPSEIEKLTISQLIFYTEAIRKEQDEQIRISNRS